MIFNKYIFYKKMSLHNFDFLSPRITLFFYEKRSHTSKIGGFLVLIMISLSLAYISYLLFIVVCHKRATSVFFKRFEWEAGHYSFNSSSIFHFIQIFSPESGGYFDEYNPRLMHTYTTFVHPGFKESDLGLYDHWVFDRCRKGIDDKDIEPSILENVDNFTNSVCIRYYYNSKTRQYFPMGDKEFIWPHLEHGTARRNNIYLTTIVQKCRNDSVINKIFGNCPPQEEIDEYINKYFAIYFYFTDIQIDPLDYIRPIQRYLNIITSGIGTKQTFVENYIHFSPVQIRTKEGDFFSNSKNDNSFFFDMNRKGTASNSIDYFKIVKYYHLMQNTMQVYERKYSNIFDILPQIGGVIQFIFYIFFWLNYFYNKYIIAYDTNSLFFDAKETKRNTHYDILDSKENNIRKNNIQINSNNFNINNLNNINNKIYNFQAIRHKNNNNFLNEKIYNKNNLFTFNYSPQPQKGKKIFPTLINIQDDSHLNELYNADNERSNNELIKNENSINKRILNNNTICVIKKESKKNSLFNIFDNKEEICNSKQFKTMNKYRITKASIKKIEHQKEICEHLIKDNKMRLVKKLSFFKYFKSHFVEKYKGISDFIIRFRRNLLSEEHFFKSHIKNTLFFRQYKLSKEQYISFIDCFNNL